MFVTVNLHRHTRPRGDGAERNCFRTNDDDDVERKVRRRKPAGISRDKGKPVGMPADVVRKYDESNVRLTIFDFDFWSGYGGVRTVLLDELNVQAIFHQTVKGTQYTAKHYTPKSGWHAAAIRS